MNNKITSAVVGTGFMGKQHLDAIKNIVSDIIVCTSDVETGEKIASDYGAKFYTDYETMLENETIDVVHICVPTPLHSKMTVAALKKGINVLCEKPFASSLDEAKLMVDTAKEHGVKLMIGQCVRFAKTHEYLKRCIQDERFGKLTYLECFRHGPIPDWSVGNWLLDAGKTGGAVRDLHIHDTDFLRSVFGVPETVYTKGSPRICNTTFDFGIDAVITATCCWRSSAKYVFNSGYHAAFEHATVLCKDDDVTVYTDMEEYDPLLKEEFPSYLKKGGVDNEVEYFYHCLRNNIPCDMCLAEDCYDSLRITFAQLDSMMTGKVQKVK